MVMWMSRVERKKIERKSNKYFKIYILIQIILLITTLIFVDFQVRDMLGIYESRLVGYHSLGNKQYHLDLIGKSYLVDITVVEDYLNNIFADFQEIAYNIEEWLEDKISEIVQ